VSANSGRLNNHRGSSLARTKKTLPSKVDLAYLISIGFLAKIYPLSLINEILEKTGKASRRVRQLPAQAVVYFVMAMSLWREPPLDEVLRIVCESLSWMDPTEERAATATKSAISQARSRLGPEVMRELADATLAPIARLGAPGAWYQGMRLMSIDGTTLSLPDEKDNAAHFGYPSSSRGDPAFPMLRVLGLAETGSHVVTAAEVGPYKVSEQALLSSLMDRNKFKPNMLVLADRNFYGYGLWKKACGTGANLLWRVKSNLILPVEERLSDNSFVSRVCDSRKKSECEPLKVRVIEYKLKNKNDKTIYNETYRLVTNIIDHKKTPANELAALYHERWEIESLYSELKVGLSAAGSILRSKTPDLVLQEVWGLLMAHFAVRQLITQAAGKQKKDPDELSFLNAVHVIRRKFPQAAGFPPESVDEMEE
jgi:hypothetical protein